MPAPKASTLGTEAAASTPKEGGTPKVEDPGRVDSPTTSALVGTAKAAA